MNTIHMFVDGGAIACDVNIWDGEVHSVTEDFAKVSCDTCKIKYGDYVIGQLKQQVEDLKEELADYKELHGSLENENRRQRTKLRQVTLEKVNSENALRRVIIERDNARRDLASMQRRAQGNNYYIPGYHS